MSSRHPEKSKFGFTIPPIVGVFTSKLEMSSFVEFGEMGESFDVSKVTEGDDVERAYPSNVVKSQQTTGVQLIADINKAEKALMFAWYDACKAGVSGAKNAFPTLTTYASDGKQVMDEQIFAAFPSGYKYEPLNRGEAGKQRITWTFQYYDHNVIT